MSRTSQQKKEDVNPFYPIIRWLDGHAISHVPNDNEVQKVDWLRVLPFFVMHLGCLGVIWVGWSMTAVIVAISLYFTRMLAITAFYHRYFSHKSFKTSRFTQFIFAIAGASAVQRGPLWWASHHRHHHLHSDKENDSHSPKQHGFWWSHIGWFTASKNFAPKFDNILDLLKFKELRWLDRFDISVPLLLAIALYVVGVLLEIYAPNLQTNGPQILVWGFFISTVILYHATYTVNSLAHQIGKRRYNTTDESRNSLCIALITCGEGWHNNHHHYPGSVRQGFFWWEIDTTYYFLKLLAALGIIWDLKVIPEEFKRARLLQPGDNA